MSHDCRLGWAPLAQMIADDMPVTPRAKPPALVRREATVYLDECSGLNDIHHPAGMQKLKDDCDAIAGRAQAAAASSPFTVPQWNALDFTAKSHALMEGRNFSPEEVRHILDEAAAERHPNQYHLGEWVAWKGGARPVGGGSEVAIMFRNGSGGIAIMADGEYTWPHTNGDADIVAYRVISERDARKVAEPEWIEWAGGECPLNGAETFSYKTRGGLDVAGACHAHRMRWTYIGAGTDIVAYRVLP